MFAPDDSFPIHSGNRGFFVLLASDRRARASCLHYWSSPRGAAAVLLVLSAAPGTAVAQSSNDTGDDADSGYDFFGVSALADGITTRFVLGNFLAVEEFVALSSVSAEARLEIGRSTALAVLPDPGDLVLGLSGTLAALAGVAGLPDYPAVSRADYPTDAGGRGDAGARRRPRRAAAPHRSATAPRLRPRVHRQLRRHRRRRPADSRLHQVRVGGPAHRSAHLRVDRHEHRQRHPRPGRVAAHRPGHEHRHRARRRRQDHSDARRHEGRGRRIAGMPVGIDENGFTSPNGSEAMAPIIESLAAPLAASGIRVRVTPGERLIAPMQGDAHDVGLPHDRVHDARRRTSTRPRYAVVRQGLGHRRGIGSGRQPPRRRAGRRHRRARRRGRPRVPSLDAAAARSTTSPARRRGVDAVGGTGDDDATGAGTVAAIKPMDFRSMYRWTALAMALAVALWLWAPAPARRRSSRTVPTCALSGGGDGDRTPIRRSRPALIQATPEALERFRDPRTVLAIVAGIGAAVRYLAMHLLHSLTAELARENESIRLLVHPAFLVRRDPQTHKLLELRPGSSQSGLPARSRAPRNTCRGRAKSHPAQPDEAPGWLSESWVAAEIGRLPGARGIRELTANVRRVLADVQLVADDTPAIHSKLARAVNAVERFSHGKVPTPEQLGELLRWLDRGNFIFLGYCEYAILDSGRPARGRAEAGDGTRPAPGGPRGSPPGNPPDACRSSPQAGVHALHLRYEIIRPAAGLPG